MMIFIILLVFLITVVYIYFNNVLVRKRNMIDQAYYSIDVMLKKRYDLVPLIVEVVRGYMIHERDLLVELTNLRSALMSKELPVDDKIALDNKVNDDISRTLAVAENYPNLKSNPSFIHLQGSLNETEEQLAASRRFLNAAVADYHNAIESFPSNLVAGIRGMKRRNYFILREEEKVRPLFLLSKES